MIKNKKAQPKVVSFERSAEYYYLKYQRQMDKGAYLDALDCLRTAVRKEPDNRRISAGAGGILHGNQLL